MLNPAGGFCGLSAWRHRWVPSIVAVLMIQALTGVAAGADPPPEAATEAPQALAPNGDPAGLEDRVRRLESIVTNVSEQNRKLTEQNQELTRRLQNLAASPGGSMTAPPQPPGAQAPDALPGVDPPRQSDGTGSQFLITGSQFEIGGYDWDNGQFVLVKPRDSQRTPFALNFDLTSEFRYTGFSRSATTWTDSSGAVGPVRNLSNFDLMRNWLTFNGYAIDPRLRFTATVFSSSSTNTTIFLGSIGYQFSEAFVLSAGYYKLPGSREWFDSFRYTLGADRTMATTFFRPNMSPGIWVSGEPLTGLHYVAMIANSFDGLNISANRLGTNQAFGGTVWWEPNGAFGPGVSDVEWHEEVTPRIGSSLAVSRENELSGAMIATNPEGTIFRLSDGTPLAATGALGPGVHVDAVSAQLLAFDAAVKYRGFSLSGEYYFRWLNSFRTSGGVTPISSLFAHGAYAQASYFFLPKRLEAYSRFSFVTGQFGGGNEWAGGLNWYVRESRNWRMTFDVTRINHSPADNILTGYRAGASGTLFQAQMLVDF
jgi:hypothetical protein